MENFLGEGDPRFPKWLLRRVKFDKLSRSNDGDGVEVPQRQEVAVARNNELGFRGDGAFQNSIVVGIAGDCVDGGVRDDQFADRPEYGRDRLQHGGRPVELFCKHAPDFDLNRFGVEEIASPGFGEFQQASRDTAEDKG